MSTKVLIIDDSALMRKHLRQIIEAAGYETQTARNGEEGLEKIAEFDPAVVTLDINMPVMDGLTCLSLIMQQYPRPVVMVSSLTEKGALATFEALELGAIDYVSKPGGTVSLNIQDIADELLVKVTTASRARIGKSRGLRERLRNQRNKVEAIKVKSPQRATAIRPVQKRGKGLVIIGVSTGGPSTLEEIITALPADFSLPILVAQHMPGRFTQVFAERLNKVASINVIELRGTLLPAPGQVIIAQGGADIKLVRRGTKLMASSVPVDNNFLWHPSVERMATSVKELYDPANIICVHWPGMGDDGAKTMTELHSLGARCIAESEETAVVYGMPKELVEQGGADCILPSYAIAEKLIEWTN